MNGFRRRVSWLALGVAAMVGIDTCESCQNATSASDGPGPIILAPTEGQQFVLGDTVWLTVLIPEAVSMESGLWNIADALGATVPPTGSPLTSTFIDPAALALGSYTAAYSADLVERNNSYTATDRSAFTVVAPPNQPPSVAITSPTAGASLASGSTVMLTGTATDPEDGTLDDTSLAWSSSADGPLGSGASLAHTGFSVGAHVITLTATDSQGATASASVDVTVMEQAGATIQGTVTIGGQPRGGVALRLSGRAAATTTTASDGTYAFSGLPFGEYLVSITPPAGAEFPVLDQTVFVAAGQTVVVNFAGS